jgi:hypothetical protein
LLCLVLSLLYPRGVTYSDIPIVLGIMLGNAREALLEGKVQYS